MTMPFGIDRDLLGSDAFLGLTKKRPAASIVLRPLWVRRQTTYVSKASKTGKRGNNGS